MLFRLYHYRSTFATTFCVANLLFSKDSTQKERERKKTHEISATFSRENTYSFGSRSLRFTINLRLRAHFIHQKTAQPFSIHFSLNKEPFYSSFALCFVPFFFHSRIIRQRKQANFIHRKTFELRIIFG